MIETLAQALAARGYESLTPVQQAVTAPEIADQDLLVSAQTGSGKTVGFGLAIAPTLLAEGPEFGRADAPLALIIAPTRELALQVMRELQWLYANAGAKVVSCVGGMDVRDETRALSRGAHIVVGTPGRLCDHVRRGALRMDSLRAVVLDEADEMLDLGFREDLEYLLGESPEERRTLLFSATVPPMIAKLAGQFQRNAKRVTVEATGRQHADISYEAMLTEPSEMEKAIVNTLLKHDARNAIVFGNTRATVSSLTSALAGRGFAVVALSGELSQAERTNALQAMRDGRARVCIATDVAARGIDLPNLELVIHAELPSSPDTLLHRSGRTGRAGRKGTAVMMSSPRNTKKLERLLKFAKLQVEWTSPPTAEEILRLNEERLLASDVLSIAPTADEAAFAEKLLALHDPKVIAAAFLRMNRSRQSAPEVILGRRERPAHLGERAERGDRPERKERSEFGPSMKVVLSAGRDIHAEPRWLLPLICRTTGISRDDIGAIRVRPNQTFVEIALHAEDAFFKAIGGENGELDEGITARRATEADAADEANRGPAKPRFDKERAFREDRPRRDDRPRDDRRDDRPRRDDRSRDDRRDDRPRGDFGGKPKAAGNKEGFERRKAVKKFNDAASKPYARKKA